MKVKWFEKTKKLVSVTLVAQMLLTLLIPAMMFAAAPTLVQADQNDPDTAFHTQDSTPTLTGATIGGTTVTVTVNSFVCVSPVVSSGWSCDGSFITTPLTPNVLYSIRMEATNADGSIITTDLTGVIVDTIGPVISERNPVPTRTSSNTPQYDFNTDSYGVITFAGGCSSGQTSAYDPWQRLDFLTLSDGLYDSCTIYTTDSAGNQSNVINVSDFTVDTVGPTLSGLGFKYSTNLDPTEHLMPGDSTLGWNLDRDGEATTNYLLSFSDTTTTNENLGVGYYPLMLTGLDPVLGVALASYYNIHLTDPTEIPFRDYLLGALMSINPFAYIKADGSTTPQLIDAAKHDLMAIDVPMTIPGDAPEGEYTVSGHLHDDLGNDSQVYNYKLIVGDITAPTLTEVTPVPSLTNVITPSYTFNSDEEGDITYGGSCSSVTTTAVEGDNTVVFGTLSDGIYDDCTITVTDEAGNASTALDVNEFEVDASAPVTTLAYSLGTAGTNGWYKGSTPPTITLSTNETATIYWKWNDETVYTFGTVNQNPIVTEGSRTLEYYSIDPATNEELPHQFETVKYDGTAPTGTVVINGGAAWTNNVDVTLTLASVDGLSGVAQMKILNAGSSYQGPFAYAGTFPWTLNAAEGQKTVRVKFIDEAGNEMATGSPDTIKLDLTAPRVVNLEVVDVDAGVIPLPDLNPFAVGDHTIRVRAEVYDDQGVYDSGINTARCQITIDGSNWTQFTASYNPTTGRCIGDIPANYFVDGQLVSGFNVRVRDIAGNIGVGAGTARTVDSLGPTNGVMTFEPIYLDTMAGQINMSVPMSDTSGISTCQFRYYFDGSFSDWVGGYWDSVDQQCEIGFGGMTHGRIYELQMRGIDGVGHFGEIVTSGPKVVDSEAPEVKYIDPTPVDGLSTNQNSQTFKIDTDDDVASCTIDLGLGTGDFESGNLSGWSTGGNASWRISTDAISGSYSAQSGNLMWINNVSSWISREVDVPSSTNITFKQKVSSEGGWDYLRFYIDGAQYSAISGWHDWHQVSFPITAGHHTISWYYTKDFSVTSGLDSGFIDDIQIGGVALGLSDQFMTSNGDGTWTYGPVSLPDGPRSYTTTCVDQVGNTTTTESRTLTIDTTAPTAPGVPVDNKNNPTNQKWVTWSWDASSDLYSGVDRYEWVIEKDEVQVASGSVAGDVTSKAKSLNWGDGDYVFKVRAVDGLGNTSGYSVSEVLTLDQTDPVAPVLDWPYDPYYTTSQTNTFYWYPVDDAYRYRIEFCAEDPGDDGLACNNVIDEKMGISSNQKTYTFGSSDMRSWWRVRTRDEAGNLSPWGESREVVIDNTAPTSSVDTLPRYINTEMFNVEITSDDFAPTLNVRGFVEGPVLTEEQGSGVQYVELWYRKDRSACPMVVPNIAAFVKIESESCVDGYVRYPGEFDPSEPIEFDTTLTGGDGFYEFFSVAVDNAGNREETPIIFTLLRIVEEDVNLDEVMPDTSTTVDTKAPVITLNGSSLVNLIVGDTFSDPGATTDDGSLVVVTGTVNTGIVGSYLLTYDSVDNAGNRAISVTRTVSVAEAVVIPRLTTFVAETPEVQGATNPEEETVTPPADGPEVQGAAADDETEDGVNAWQKFFNYKVFGIKTWMWLLFFALVLGGWWFLMTDRKKKRT